MHVFSLLKIYHLNNKNMIPKNKSRKYINNLKEKNCIADIFSKVLLLVYIDFYIDVLPTTLSNPLFNSNTFPGYSFVLYIFICYIFTMNNESPLFLSNPNAFCFFFLLFVIVTSFKTMLNQGGESKYSYMDLYLKWSDFKIDH